MKTKTWRDNDEIAYRGLLNLINSEIETFTRNDRLAFPKRTLRSNKLKYKYKFTYKRLAIHYGVTPERVRINIRKMEKIKLRYLIKFRRVIERI